MIPRDKRIVASDPKRVSTREDKVSPISPKRRNCQKISNIIPAEPVRSPKARGSLRPPSTAVCLKKLLGEKRTALEVRLMPAQMPCSVLLSHGDGIRPTSVSTSFCAGPESIPKTGDACFNSNLCLHWGQVAHLALAGIRSWGNSFEKWHLGQMIFIIICSFSFPLPLAGY